jgi:hypothetical protein
MVLQAGTTTGWEGSAGMGADEAKDYAKLKRAILRRYDINDESYRQQFRAAVKKSDETNRELVARLNDLAGKWMKTNDDKRHDCERAAHQHLAR